MNKILLISLAFVLVFASTASAEYRDILPYSSQLYADTNMIGTSNTNEFTIKQGANLDSSVIIRMNRTNKNTSTAGIHGTVSIYPDTTAATNTAGITLAGTTGAISGGAITGTGTVILSGSSISLGNSVANDTVTVTADVVAAANADVDLTASGVTLRAASVAATTLSASGVTTLTSDVNMTDTLAVSDTIQVGTAADDLAGILFVTTATPGGVRITLDDAQGSAIVIENGIITAEGVFTGEVSMRGSSINLGNGVAADTVTVTADVVGAANADWNLTQSGVTLRANMLSASGDVDLADSLTVTGVTILTDNLTVNGSAIGLGNSVTADTVTVTAEMVGATNAVLDFDQSAAAGIRLPANSIGGTELTDSAALKMFVASVPFDTAVLTGDSFPIWVIRDANITILRAEFLYAKTLAAETYTLNIRNYGGVGSYIVNPTVQTAGLGINLDYPTGGLFKADLTLAATTADVDDVIVVGIGGGDGGGGEKIWYSAKVVIYYKIED